MHLKSLELMGFKSFGRKTVFDFTPGLTAIIGPNGSGKSNVCDAIRWVLGEQSAKALRGTKMSEVIFAGSSEYRPSAFAQVKLILDNEDHSMPVDYTEVSIGRQLFRSGESNYILNNTRTTMTSIKEMLMDTGIGKDGYSVIGQGDIDDIIFQRIQPRRALIEEAAGITRFKHRKKNALDKLAHTRTNMTRITDIISEIEGQLGPLAEQAEKTRKYQALAAEIRQLEIDLILYDLNSFYGERENINSMRIGLLARIDEIDKFLAEVDEKKAGARIKFDEFDSLLKSRQSEINSITGQVDTRRDNISQLLQKVNRQQARSDALKEELANIEESLMAGNEEITDAANRLRDEENKESAVSENMQELETNVAAVRTELNSHMAAAAKDKESSLKLAMKMAELKTNINIANQQISQLELQLAKGETSVANAQANIDGIKEKLTKLEKDIGTIEAEIELNKNQLNSENSRLVVLEKDCKNTEEELNGIAEQIKLKTSRKAIVEALMHNDKSGIYRGVQAALALKETGRLPGICGIVGELIRVPNGYEVALETALGGSIQSIITRDADTAKAAISILKQNKAGKATFLPLDLMKAPPTADKPNFKGCLGVALDLIEFDAKYYTALSNLLGRVLVFDNIDNAVAYTRISRNFSRIVTLDGETVSASGSMTGGGEEKKAGGILSRKRELEDIISLITSLESKQRSVKMQYSKLATERQRLLESIKARETTIIQRENSLSFFKSQYELTSSDLSSKQNDFNNITADRAGLSDGLARYKKELEDNSAELKNLEQQNKDLTEALESQKDVEAAILARLDALNEMIGNKKIEKAQVLERIKAIQKEIDAANRRKRDFEDRKKRATEEVNELDKMTAEDKQTVEVYQKEIDELSNKRDSINHAMEAVQEEYARMSREIETLDRTYQSRVKIVDSTKNKLNELDVKLAEINTHINTKEGILNGDYSYNQDPALFNPKKYESREDLSGSIDLKRFEQMGLGTVNPLAIEDYEKTKERFDFLNSQLADLNEAATSLEELIDEIEKTSTEKFMEAFNLINTAFEHIFEILFPGGSGTLKLSDKEDVLNSNVDVICRLPGKKLTTLELFSGGEKSMISLALLFSILEVKPPAFCLLDEVEAALDEANVKRFNRMLRSFADKTQFLVITHNKETMQTVDVIYGVTMQKGGISKPISIRLEDNDKIKEFTFDGKGQPKERSIKLTEKAA